MNASAEIAVPASDMNKSYKTAIGGLSIALTVVLMIPTVIGSFVYVFPAIASMIVLFCVIELNKKWAFGVFAGASIISLVAIPNKEAAVIYAAFFGWYPIAKAIIESKRFHRIIEYVIKFALFNFSVILAYVLIIRIMGIPYEQLMGIEEGDYFLAKYGIYLFIVLGNLAFVMLDRLFTLYATIYLRRYQKIFRKTFRFKR